MGYHVIIDPEAFPVKYTYVEQIGELLNIEGINERSIVFQGTPENPPQQVGVSKDFAYLGEDWYRAGLRAQVIFAKLSRARMLELEELSQDIENFTAYSEVSRKPLKRGDFLIRNLGNIEVEVKCRSFYGKGARKYFLFSKEDLMKHVNMEELTGTHVVIAVFQRKGDIPVENSLAMIKVDRILQMCETLECEEKTYGTVLHIPLKELLPGFNLLSDYGLEKEEDVVDILEEEDRYYPITEKSPYVLVAFYKSIEHLEWILRKGLYNLRMGTDRGALSLGLNERAARYILLHTTNETRTGKLFQILDGPEVFSREELIAKKYPGLPGHSRYLVYKVVPLLNEQFNEPVWDITTLTGYIQGRGSAVPFAVPFSELMK